MKLTLTFLVLVSIVSCKFAERIEIDDKTYKVNPPPGTVFISHKFYADRTERTLLDYKEYMNWMERFMGTDSKEYKSILLDSSVINEVSQITVEEYFKEPYYNDYPIVGITLEQAKKYTNWRTDRVAQVILMHHDFIYQHYTYSSEDYFTLERYIAGEYPWIRKQGKILLPIYTVPTKDEFEYIASIKTNSSKSKKNLRIALKNEKRFSPLIGKTFSQPARAQSFGIDANGLFCINSNVSELVAEDGIHKGGNWHEPFGSIDVNDDLTTSAPNAWTGFRNIAKWELIEPLNSLK